MLKGEVFAEQLFENQIFALFINTFLNGTNGVLADYKNGMAITYSGSNVTIDSGSVCIQGRFLEEDTSTTLAAGTDSMYCKLVIEIDLDKTNTESDFEQGYYKIVKSSGSYPTLTQTDIVNTNSGVYQYELARFITSANGISDFQDMRTFLDYNSIYEMIEEKIEEIEDETVFAKKLNIITGQEVATSEYIDNKRVYVKRYNCGRLPNNSTKQIAHNLSGVTTVRVEGFYKIDNRDVTIFPLQYNDIGAPINSSTFFVGTTHIAITTRDNKTDCTAYVDIYYTKNNE